MKDTAQIHIYPWTHQDNEACLTTHLHFTDKSWPTFINKIDDWKLGMTRGWANDDFGWTFYLTQSVPLWKMKADSWRKISSSVGFSSSYRFQTITIQKPHWLWPHTLCSYIQLSIHRFVLNLVLYTPLSHLQERRLYYKTFRHWQRYAVRVEPTRTTSNILVEKQERVSPK